MIKQDLPQERILYSSSTAWEPLRGYSRAVKIGDSLHISGTTAIDKDAQVVGVNDAYAQTKFIIDTARNILTTAGFSLNDVYRTRMFVTDMSRWNDYARAHREAFDTIRPASGIVEVVKLKDPRLLIEMEFEAQQGWSKAKVVKL